jgi:hypothetical protein
VEVDVDVDVDVMCSDCFFFGNGFLCIAWRSRNR